MVDSSVRVMVRTLKRSFSLRVATSSCSTRSSSSMRYFQRSAHERASSAGFIRLCEGNRDLELLNRKGECVTYLLHC